MGLPERAPLPYAHDVVWYQVGATAAAATLGGLFVSSLQGVGQQVDVSALEALVGNVDSRSLFYEYTGVKTSRERWPGGIPQGAYPCQDGYVVMGVGYDLYFSSPMRRYGQAGHCSRTPLCGIDGTEQELGGVRRPIHRVAHAAYQAGGLRTLPGSQGYVCGRFSPLGS